MPFKYVPMDFITDRIDQATLRTIAGAPINRNIADGIIKHLSAIVKEFEINTELRLAHFLAQLAHESDHFRTFEEYASGRAYEGRRDLGNTQRGDGQRFKGRGPIQVTGRFNYKKYGDKLGVDLIDNPELAATPLIGMRIAGQYWKDHNLNHFADLDDGKSITRKINGGYNGLADRLRKVENAKKALKDLQLNIYKSMYNAPKANTTNVVTVGTVSNTVVSTVNVEMPSIVKIDLVDAIEANNE